METNNEDILEEKTEKEENTDAKVCINENIQYLWDLHNDIKSGKILI